VRSNLRARIFTAVTVEGLKHNNNFTDLEISRGHISRWFKRSVYIPLPAVNSGLWTKT
jgi:hypothetical protein